MTTMRESSKKEWTSVDNIEHINTGSLQRIADAVEKMATNHLELMRQRDVYMTQYKAEQRRRVLAERRIAALRGVITKLKRGRP